ncbi:MAG: ComEC family competence protein [Actinobacteria bacterium]|nr:ComEC family competence protein [Actinomycetota bacterium]
MRLRPAHALALAACVGLAFANAGRPGLVLLPLAGALGISGLGAPELRLTGLALALAAVGWWWGGVRLDKLDRSTLAPRIGTAERAWIEVTSAPRRGRFDVRADGRVLRFGTTTPYERVLLRLPPARSPPQGAILEGIGQLVEPSGPKKGFDQRTWLRRRGVHVVLRLDSWRVVGRRGGLGGVSDRLRHWLAHSVARDLHGEREAVLEGIVLGDDGGLSDTLKHRFRASGLYHLLAVSGQNVVLVAAGALMLTWLVGLSRRVGEVAALAGMAAYLLAVGPQPSVIRAGIAGALTSLAWLTARLSDRWHFLLLGALALLAWNPYTLFDAGFQLSFAAVTAIFVLYPRIRTNFEGYPIPSTLADAIAISGACGIATAPVMWIQFHAISLAAIPANALAAPAMMPLLALAFASAAIAPLAPAGAAALAWVNGWLAAYLATCARVVGGLPGAQVRSTRALLILLAAAFLVGAYAWPRWRPSSSPSI